MRRRRNVNRKPTVWAIHTWLIVLIGILALPLALYQCITFKCVNEITLFLGMVGSFFTGRLFEKYW